MQSWEEMHMVDSHKPVEWLWHNTILPDIQVLVLDSETKWVTKSLLLPAWH